MIRLVCGMGTNIKAKEPHKPISQVFFVRLTTITSIFDLYFLPSELCLLGILAYLMYRQERVSLQNLESVGRLKSIPKPVNRGSKFPKVFLTKQGKIKKSIHGVHPPLGDNKLTIQAKERDLKQVLGVSL